MKESDYNIMMIPTFSGLTMTGGHKEEIMMVNGEVVKFNYPAVVADHYRYKGSVDNHNYLRNDDRNNSQICLEIAWGTTCWPIRLFAFFIACNEVDVYLGMKHLPKNDDTFMNFEKMTKTLNKNSCID